MKTNIEQLKLRILEISKKRGSTHISSCLTALPIIDEIYQKKGDAEFILSNGHAFLAWAVIKEAYEGMNAEDLAERHGTHPNRNDQDRITVSSGSLGHGLGIALGKALTGKEIYCLVSDGELAEGSCWEALRIKKELNLRNLHVYANLNGYSALGKVDRPYLNVRLGVTCPDVEIRFTENDKGFAGVEGHYKKI